MFPVFKSLAKQKELHHLSELVQKRTEKVHTISFKLVGSSLSNTYISSRQACVFPTDNESVTTDSEM